MTKSVTVNGVEWFEGVYALREPFVHSKPDRRRAHGWRKPEGFPTGHLFKIHVCEAGSLPFGLGRALPAYVEIRTEAGEYHRLYDGASRAVDPVSVGHERALRTLASGEHPSEVVRLLSMLERVTSVERDVADALGLTDPATPSTMPVRVLAVLVREGRVRVEHLQELTAHFDALDEAARETARAVREAREAVRAMKEGT